MLAKDWVSLKVSWCLDNLSSANDPSVLVLCLPPESRTSSIRRAWKNGDESVNQNQTTGMMTKLHHLVIQNISQVELSMCFLAFGISSQLDEF